MDINAIIPASGRMIAEDGTVVNIVDILNTGGIAPSGNQVLDIEAYAPRNGRVLGEDGKMYNLVDIFRAIATGGGGGTTNHAMLGNLRLDLSGHNYIPGIPAPTEPGDPIPLAQGNVSAVLDEITLRMQATNNSLSDEARERSNEISGIAVDSEAAQLSIARIYQGVDLTQKHQEEIASIPFNGDPWAWIQARIRVNNFTSILPGDFIPLPIGGNIFNMEVAGINTYERYGNIVVPRHIDFISRELWPNTIQWNLVNYNNGLAAQTTPFLASNANQELNPKKIAQATLAKIKAVNPAEERTFEAFWIFVFSIIQLLKDSMTCLTPETAVEKIASQ